MTALPYCQGCGRHHPAWSTHGPWETWPGACRTCRGKGTITGADDEVPCWDCAPVPVGEPAMCGGGDGPAHPFVQGRDVDDPDFRSDEWCNTCGETWTPVPVGEPADPQAGRWTVDLPALLDVVGRLVDGPLDPRVDMPLTDQVRALIEWATSPTPDEYTRSVPVRATDHDELICGALGKLVAIIRDQAAALNGEATHEVVRFTVERVQEERRVDWWVVDEAGDYLARCGNEDNANRIALALNGEATRPTAEQQAVIDAAVACHVAMEAYAAGEIDLDLLNAAIAAEGVAVAALTRKENET